MTNLKGFKSRYEVNDHEWLDRCRSENCNKKRIKCPVCKHYGHYQVHKKETK